MAVLEIKQYPEQVLRTKTRPVEAITPDLLKLLDDMAETMYAAPGVGLAAPQVGVSLRVAVLDVSTKEHKFPLIELINPEIIMTEGELEEDEGCLSIQDFTAPVRRFARVRVRATDRAGMVYELEGEDLLARAIQHEVDHLDGLLFIDRLSPLKRDLFKRRIRKAMKEEVEAS